MKMTCVEISNKPIEPRIIYVLFDDPEKAAEFVDEVKEDYDFHFLKSYEDDEKRFAYPFGRSREVFANTTLAKLKEKLYGTGWR